MREKLSSKLAVEPRDGGGRLLTFMCPGCKDTHQISIERPQRPSWTWDGNAEEPTFHPSVKVTYGKGTEDEEVCHSFVRRGVFEFLGDCTHDLKNQKAPLQDLPDWLFGD